MIKNSVFHQNWKLETKESYPFLSWVTGESHPGEGKCWAMYIRERLGAVLCLVLHRGPVTPAWPCQGHKTTDNFAPSSSINMYEMRHMLLTAFVFFFCQYYLLIKYCKFFFFINSAYAWQSISEWIVPPTTTDCWSVFVYAERACHCSCEIVCQCVNNLFKWTDIFKFLSERPLSTMVQLKRWGNVAEKANKIMSVM